MQSPESCRGRYRYYLNAKPAAIDESWECEGDYPVNCLIKSRRNAGPVRIAVSAKLAKGVVIDTRLSWHNDGGPSVFAHYYYQGDTLYLDHRVGDELVQQSSVESKTGRTLVLYPLMRIFTGPIIDSIICSGEACDVVVPNITALQQPCKLLTAEVSPRSASVLDEERFVFGGARERVVRLCLFEGGSYDQSARFWLAENARLLRYQWQQGTAQQWDIVISNDG